jgi:hypothetical protein
LAVFGFITVVARWVSALLRRLAPGVLSFPWRQGLANLHRPSNQTTAVMLAIGLGTFLMVTLYNVQSMLLNQVRERAGNIANDPETFTTADRFKVLLTCPPGARVHWEVVVFQSGEPSFPLQRGVSECGNRSVLPGAFRLTDMIPTSVCLLLSEREPPSRAELHRRGMSVLPALTVCRTLHPAEPAPHPAEPASLGEDD